MTNEELQARIQATRGRLKAKPDPALVDALILARARLHAAYAAELEAEHAYAQRKPKRERRSGWRGGQPRCDVCHKFKATHDADCGSCGYTGHGYAHGFGGN